MGKGHLHPSDDGLPNREVNDVTMFRGRVWVAYGECGGRVLGIAVKEIEYSQETLVAPYIQTDMSIRTLKCVIDTLRTSVMPCSSSISSSSSSIPSLDGSGEGRSLNQLPYPSFRFY